MTKADREILGKLTDVISSLQTELTSLKSEIGNLRKDQQTESNLYRYSVYLGGVDRIFTSRTQLIPGRDYIRDNRTHKLYLINSVCIYPDYGYATLDLVGKEYIRLDAHYNIVVV